jgi:DNA polymerase zeta
VAPTEFLDPRRRATLTVNYQYYIHKQMIPSLERLFLLMGANVRLWYTQLPRVIGKARAKGPSTKSRQAETRSIDSFYMSKHCRLCGTMGQNTLCRDCESHPQRSEFVRQVLAVRRDRSLERLRLVCMACGGRDAMEVCKNVSCGVWNRTRLLKAGREHEEFTVSW